MKLKFYGGNQLGVEISLIVKFQFNEKFHEKCLIT